MTTGLADGVTIIPAAPGDRVISSLRFYLKIGKTLATFKFDFELCT